MAPLGTDTAKARSRRPSDAPAGPDTHDETKRFYVAVTETERPVAVAVLDAGVGQGGAFDDTDLEDALEIVDLNVRSTVKPAKRMVRDLASDGPRLVRCSPFETTGLLGAAAARTRMRHVVEFLHGGGDDGRGHGPLGMGRRIVRSITFGSCSGTVTVSQNGTWRTRRGRSPSRPSAVPQTPARPARPP
ncbi:hypothetical protein ACIQU4_18350 [Streptomyces sp. NPDC090741]|uniref:hypothetical protein n=1 Tax=Streptomyces sp. NPDC090741 TaxID=3365967 RepID=UPI0037FBA35D